MVAGMLIPLDQLRAIYEVLFREGVMLAKKDKRPQSFHAHVPGVTNLQVARAMGSLKARGYVRETFVWRHFYWYLNNEGIIYLRQYKSLVTGKRARATIAVIWILSLGIGLTPLMGWNRWDYECGVNRTMNMNETGWRPPGCSIKCLFESVVTMSYMVYFNFFGCVLLPLLIMLGIYIKIFMVARKQLRQIELKCISPDNSRTIRSTLQKEVNAAKSLAIIVGLFAFCWLPVHILNCSTLFAPNLKKPMEVMYTGIILSHANSVVNPIIYAYKIQEFRYTFRKIISKYFVCKKDNFSKCPNGKANHSRQMQISSVTNTVIV